MLNAYLDDFNLIRIETDKKISEYWLWNGQECFDYTLSKTYKLGESYVLEIYIEETWDFAKDYLIFNNFGEKNTIKERNIVRSLTFDDLFYYDGSLGSFYTKEKTSFKVWAPISREVLVVLNPNDGVKEDLTIELNRGEHGVYTGEALGDFADYHYVYVIKTHGEWSETVDPYGKYSLVNSTASAIVNPQSLEVASFDTTSYPIDKRFITDSIIYELHIRDFSIQDGTPFQHKGKFLAFTEKGLTLQDGTPIGLDYLKDLGITHVQLLPIFDFSSVTEFPFDQNYNWGYDPEQFDVVEGRYATNPYIPENRVVELKQFIQSLKESGIGVIMDVVYNHVYNYKSYAFQKIVPGYFFRFDEENKIIQGSGAGADVASERKMVRKYIVDSLLYWMKTFKINGFRFDLMGLLDIETMQFISQTLRAHNPYVYLYGEGWNMDTGIPESHRSTIDNAHLLPDIGFFNAYFRDIVKGSTFETTEHGLASNNIHFIGTSENLLKGCISHQFIQPIQSINYVACHDNYTLYDRLKFNADETQILAYQKMCFSFVLLSQGVPFLHAGDEFSRTKNGVENSYNSPDAINQIDWSLIHKNTSLLQFVKKLITIRKKFNALRFKIADEIKKHVTVFHDYHLIHYRIQDIQTFDKIDELYILFNVTNKTVTQYLDSTYQELLLEYDYTCYQEKNVVLLEPFTIKILIKGEILDD